MNVVAHQKKNKNTERERQEKKDTECYPCVVYQRAAGRKNCWMWGVSGITGTLEKVNSHFDPPQTESGPHHHV